MDIAKIRRLLDKIEEKLGDLDEDAQQFIGDRIIDDLNDIREELRKEETS